MSDSPLLADTRTGAVLSDDRTYRYRLWRQWDVSKPTLAFVMLNPSTADETDDDPTIRRCLGYAKDWGYGSLVVGNLFALRSPDPERLREHDAPVGPENDAHLEAIAAEADRVVAAWGANGSLHDRAREVADLLAGELVALETTKSGHPVHPLYQPVDAEPEPWTADELE